MEGLNQENYLKAANKWVTRFGNQWHKGSKNRSLGEYEIVHIGGTDEEPYCHVMDGGGYRKYIDFRGLVPEFEENDYDFSMGDIILGYRFDMHEEELPNPSKKERLAWFPASMAPGLREFRLFLVYEGNHPLFDGLTKDEIVQMFEDTEYFDEIKKLFL